MLFPPCIYCPGLTKFASNNGILFSKIYSGQTIILGIPTPSVPILDPSNSIASPVASPFKSPSVTVGLSEGNITDENMSSVPRTNLCNPPTTVSPRKAVNVNIASPIVFPAHEIIPAFTCTGIVKFTIITTNKDIIVFCTIPFIVNFFIFSSFLLYYHLMSLFFNQII